MERILCWFWNWQSLWILILILDFVAVAVADLVAQSRPWLVGWLVGGAGCRHLRLRSRPAENKLIQGETHVD